MKYIISESQSKKLNILNQCWYGANVGDVLSEEIIYQYVQIIHREYDDFVEGDLGERIEGFEEYMLQVIDLNMINLDEYELYDYDYNESIRLYKEGGDYPPIVLGDIEFGLYNIIDGNHRANALKSLGILNIHAWVGV